MIDLRMSRSQSKLGIGCAVLVARPWYHDQIITIGAFELFETKRLIVINYYIEISLTQSSITVHWVRSYYFCHECLFIQSDFFNVLVYEFGFH